MPTTAKVVLDSISESGVRLITLVLEYPRIIHSEFMTHRLFSRNASSSRAIPVEKQIERIQTNAFFPSQFGKNKRGMQADEQLDIEQSEYAELTWNRARLYAVSQAKELASIGVHKQLANRLLEPFSHIQVIVTATEWDNFFNQRLDPAAQPEIQELARVMKEAIDKSTPKLLTKGEWHLPFISSEDKGNAHQYANSHPLERFPEILIKLSVARSAKVSYGLNERGWGDIEKDLELYDRLFNSGHWSPFEHQATPMCQPKNFIGGYSFQDDKGITHMDINGNLWSGNFKGWIQNRQLIQQSI